MTTVERVRERLAERRAENARIYSIYLDYRQPPFHAQTLDDIDALLSHIAALAAAVRAHLAAPDEATAAALRKLVGDGE